jgi:hypothetical protein
MIFGKRPYELRNKRNIQNRDHSNTQSASQLAWFQVQLLKRILDFAQDSAGVLLENETARSEQNPLSSPLKEGNSQAGFQIAHLLRNAGLGKSEAIRCPAKTSRFGHGQEITKVP